MRAFILAAALSLGACQISPALGQTTPSANTAVQGPNAHIKEARLPEVDVWLAQHHN